MKGDVNFEFIISVSVFLIVVTYISFSVVNLIPYFHDQSTQNIGLSKSYQVSEMLLFSEGFPNDWETGGINYLERPGLSNGTQYYLDETKLDKMQELCQNNYSDFKEKMNIDYRMSVYINVSSPSEQWYCGSGNEVSTSYEVKRFALLNNELTEIKISVY